MKILLIQTGFLGDVLLSTPVIAGLRMIFPKAEITALTTREARPLLEHHPELHEVLVYDKRGADAGFTGLRKVAATLRAREFGLAVSLHKSFRTAVLLLLSGIRRRIGFREAALWWTYTQTTKRSHLPHDVLRNLVVLEPLGARLEDLPKAMSVYAGDAARSEADKLLRPLNGKSLVGIAPGSVWLTKRWTEEGFQETASQLAAAGFGIVVLGGPADAPLGERLVSRIEGQAINLAGKASLSVSAAVVERLDVLVTNDSAPLHIASCVGTPVAALFCATTPEMGYGPWQVPHEIVAVAGLRCRPCGRHGGRTCPTGTHACRYGITAAEVTSAAFRLSQIRRDRQAHAS